jgi:homoserine/homoserine lactone efflux protein
MPVQPETLLAFVLASLVLLVIPGPTVIMMISQALAHGRGVALASALGVGLGDLLAASLSIAGVGTILAASALLFEIVKAAGAGYLIWIGVVMWRSPPRLPEDLPAPPALPRRRLFRQAFLVTVLNPKSIIFFMAFVPQFIRADAVFVPQAATFVLVFVVLGILNAWAYAELAGSARRIIRRPRVLRGATRTGAVLLIGAGIAALLTRRMA